MGLDGENLSDQASLTTEELAYIAGFFDGEGSITIHENCKPSPRGKNPNHTLQVSIGNTDDRVLIWLHQVFGGNFVVRKTVPKPNHRQVSQWVIRSNGAAKFLTLILPFLRMKTEQTKIALSFQAEKGQYRKKQLTQDEIDFRESQRRAIRILNGRNVA